MSLGVANRGPGPGARQLSADEGGRANAVGGSSDIRDFEKDDGLVGGRVVFDTFTLKAKKRSAGGELGVVVGPVLFQLQPDCVLVEVLRNREVVEIELKAGQANLLAHDLSSGHCWLPHPDGLRFSCGPKPAARMNLFLWLNARQLQTLG